METETLDDGHKEEKSRRQRKPLGDALSAAKTEEADVLILSHEFSLRCQKSIRIKLPRVLK